LLNFGIQKRFNEDFSIDNVCFGVLDLLKRIRSKELPVRKGELFILEEAGTSMGALDFANKTSKIFSYILQSFRSMNLCLLMNLPYFTMLNKQARELVHIQLETLSIDPNEKKLYLKPFTLQTNATSGKLYRHFPRVVINSSMECIEYISYGLPSKELAAAYEGAKQDFVLQTIDDGINAIEELETKNNGDKGTLLNAKDYRRRTYLEDEHNVNELAVSEVISVSAAHQWLKTQAKHGWFPPWDPRAKTPPEMTV